MAEQSTGLRSDYNIPRNMYMTNYPPYYGNDNIPGYNIKGMNQ
jgi:hypothetical protein